jgi:hypothetical protein
MAFTKSLYYPWIEVQDEIWLKNAILYWDTIQTIVPESITDPYTGKTAKEFYEAEALVPLQVNPELVGSIDGLMDDAMKYLETSEGMNVLLGDEIHRGEKIHFEKLSYELANQLDRDIHFDKLPYRIGSYLCNGHRNENNWLSVDARFASFYMTLLATRLADQKHLGLLSDRRTIEQLSRAVRLDSTLQFLPGQHMFPGPRHFRHHAERINSVKLAQGMLAELAIERINSRP